METAKADDVKKSSKRKTPPNKEIDWVEPDFCETAKLSSSVRHKQLLTDTDNYHKSKEHFPLLENYKCGRKIKPFSVDEKYKHFKQNHSQIEPWVDKYKPKTQSDLVIHKKKIEEVERWLKDHIFQNQPRQGGSILVLTGPPGCGKSATVEILAKDLGIQIQEWINPVSLDFKKHDFQVAFNHESDFKILPYQSQAAIFQEFLLRANKYIKLQMVGETMETDKRLILVEDMPNHFYHDPSSLHDILRSFLRTSRCPLVFIISDIFSTGSSQRSLFPKAIQEELYITTISFNPVAPTLLMKALNRIITGEISMRRDKIDVPDKPILELICSGCSGDIRSAINTLQFSSLQERPSDKSLWSQRKKKSVLKCDTSSKIKEKTLCNNFLEDQEIPAIGSKDASIFLFHALGKILYCKREPGTEMDFPRLPHHLSEYERQPLLVQPEDVIEKSHMPGDLFNVYLHQNYLEFFSDIDDIVRASEYLSTADFLCTNWDARATLQKYSASVATRGVMHSNRARAFAQCKRGMGFRPLHKPQWFLINRKYQENCFAAKSLFSSFCLSPLCLQTELIPYLTMLTNPMRNQAQITFIQDVGKLPLRNHFGRLKLETLTDKDSAIQILDNDDEEFSEKQSTILHIQGEKIKNSEENELDEFLPASSQSNENELPASQPQPVAAQAIMEADDLNIEEYDSE
ncbi:LOW QUALITY PROTEIN: cell cycle checkpoint protein RAD17 [Pantherophis guttatus]|uniref:LOW QUALITY PROTEIN: cell cycle checkpoint protein RAD17 n=1 Tax=Pantherophis guttatus TaxID=94885 RepID=A0A6P9E182_PANGU|nr:LOW QUALITY PROTEIN: cell cycle checkpoint protein RAD17 [Pantherophis guttatus]